MKHHLTAAILPVEAFPHTRHKDYRKFQAFTMMNAHDPHSFPAFAGQVRFAEIHLIFLQLLDITDEMKQAMITDLFIVLRFLKEHLYIGSSLLPARQRPHLVHISGFCNNLPEQFVNGCIRCLTSVLVHLCKKPAKSFF